MSTAVVCIINAFTPKLGIWLSNGLGVFKIIILVLVISLDLRLSQAGCMRRNQITSPRSTGLAQLANCPIHQFYKSRKLCSRTTAGSSLSEASLPSTTLNQSLGPVLLLGMAERQLCAPIQFAAQAWYSLLTTLLGPYRSSRRTANAENRRPNSCVDGHVVLHIGKHCIREPRAFIYPIISCIS